MLLKTSPRRLLQLSTHRHTHLPPTLPLSTLRSSLTHSFTSTSQQPQRQLETKVVDDTQTVPDKLLGTRQELEQRRKEFEEKYAHQLKRKMEEAKVETLSDLKERIAPRKIASQAAADSTTARPAAESSPAAHAKRQPSKGKNPQAAADRAGIKPLSSILNLDLIFTPSVPSSTSSSTANPADKTPRPHTTSEISLLWQAYHTTHPTLAETYLSAAIPPEVYRTMILAGKKCDRFVVPLPREVSGQPDGTNGYEMFYLQWLFHPTEGVDLASWHRNQTEGAHSPLPISTVLFTPLAEFRSSGEWAQPHLVLTHYPDLYNIPPSSSTSVTASASNPIHHPLVLLRGEILSSPSASPLASPLPTSHLALSQSRAQLLSVALQRFYIAARPVPGETEQERIDREKRRDALDMFSRGDEKFDWEGLVGMAYGGVV